MSLNLYVISQDVNNGYDTYSEAVVVAESEDEARRMHPDSNSIVYEEVLEYSDDGYWSQDTWCKLGDVRVERIGVAVEGMERGVVVSSFHAG